MESGTVAPLRSPPAGDKLLITAAAARHREATTGRSRASPAGDPLTRSFPRSGPDLQAAQLTTACNGAQSYHLTQRFAPARVTPPSRGEWTYAPGHTYCASGHRALARSLATFATSAPPSSTMVVTHSDRCHSQYSCLPNWVDSHGWTSTRSRNSLPHSWSRRDRSRGHSVRLSLREHRTPRRPPRTDRQSKREATVPRACGTPDRRRSLQPLAKGK